MTRRRKKPLWVPTTLRVVIALAIGLSCAMLVSECRRRTMPIGFVSIGPIEQVPAQLTVANETSVEATAYVAFGDNSAVLPDAWAVCTPLGPLGCSFPIGARTSIGLPLDGHYLNATLSFDAPVACGTTKAELNLNDPAWYDVADVSLVDGFSNFVTIQITDPAAGAGTWTIGPPKGPFGNEDEFGVFPLGCDMCVAREQPPCGIPQGTDGCKAGMQYDPRPPCQYKGATMGGGSTVRVALVPPTRKR